MCLDKYETGPYIRRNAYDEGDVHDDRHQGSRPQPLQQTGHGGEQEREIELLLQVNRRMAAYDSLDDVLAALVDMTTSELGTERGSLFLNDPDTNELYSRVAQGNFRREIRILNNSGIAGHVYTSG